MGADPSPAVPGRGVAPAPEAPREGPPGARRNLRLTIEYDGRDFHGWQRQALLRTVQGELEAAATRLLGEPITLHAAGRTDAGVHALGQVASFRTRATLASERIRRGMNALSGRDVVVRAAAEAPEDFHARFSARARHYLYLTLDEPSALWAGRALCLRRAPDLERMNAAVGALVGDHDFAAFSCRGDDDERSGTRSLVLHAGWERWSRGLALHIGAVRFLYKMVRAIVARSLEVGYGKREAEWFAQLLAAHDERAGAVARAAGLYLAAVDYDAAPASRPGAPGPSLAGWMGAADCPPRGPVL